MVKTRGFTQFEVTIKGNEWKVRRAKSLHDDYGNECYGICDYNIKTIFVRTKLSKDLERLVFIHEVLHAAMSELHLDIDYTSDEVLADGLSTILDGLFDIRLKNSKTS